MCSIHASEVNRSSQTLRPTLLLNVLLLISMTVTERVTSCRCKVWRIWLVQECYPLLCSWDHFRRFYDGEERVCLFYWICCTSLGYIQTCMSCRFSRASKFQKREQLQDIDCTNSWRLGLCSYLIFPQISVDLIGQNAPRGLVESSPSVLS